MARTIPAAYPKPNPDLSFIPGTGKLDDGTGTTFPPHGPRDLGLALNYLFARGMACVVIPQIWRKSEEIKNVTAGYPAEPDLIYQIPADSAFPELHLTVYYLANTDYVGAFKVAIPELGEEIELASEDADGAQRLVEVDWSPAGLTAWAGGELTVEVYVKGDSDSSKANRLCAFYVERNPVSGSVPSGRHYDPEFIGLDSTALDQDAPLSSDLMFDMRADVIALKEKRKRPFLQWSRQGGTLPADFGGFLSTLIPILVTGRRNTNHGTARTLGTAAGTLHVCGGRAGIADGPYTEAVDLENGVWKGGSVTIEGNGLLPIEGPYAQVIAQVGSITPSPPAANLAALRSASIWGP